MVFIYDATRWSTPPKVIEVGARPDGFAFDGNFVWVTISAPGGNPSVMLLNPAADSIVDTIPLPSGSEPLSIVYDGTANMYVGYGYALNAVAKIDVAKRAIVDTFYVPGAGAAQIRGLMYQSGDGVESVWTCNSAFGSVTRFNASNGARLATYPTGNGTMPGEFAFDGANVWIANSGANFLTVVRPSEPSLLVPTYGLSL
jgi:streptogramin lyase